MQGAWAVAQESTRIAERSLEVPSIPKIMHLTSRNIFEKKFASSPKIITSYVENLIFSDKADDSLLLLVTGSLVYSYCLLDS